MVMYHFFIKCQFVLKSLHTLPKYNSHYSSTRHNQTKNRSSCLVLRTKIISNINRDLHIPVITPTSRRVQLHSLHPRSVTIRLYHWLDGQGPFPPPPPIFGFLDTFWVNDPLMHSLTTWPPVCTHPESWQMDHYYILYFKSLGDWRVHSERPCRPDVYNCCWWPFTWKESH